MKNDHFPGPFFATARLGFHFLFIFHSFSVSILRKNGNKMKWEMNEKRMKNGPKMPTVNDPIVFHRLHLCNPETFLFDLDNQVLMSNDLPGVAVPTSPFDGISHVTCARTPGNTQR